MGLFHTRGLGVSALWGSSVDTNESHDPKSALHFWDSGSFVSSGHASYVILTLGLLGSLTVEVIANVS